MSKASEILGRSEAPAKKPAATVRPAARQAAAPAKKRPAAIAPVKKTGAAKARKPQEGRVLRLVLNHAAIILSLMYLVFFVIDRINNAMEFINNDMTKVLLVLLAVISIVNAEIALHTWRKKR